MVNVMIKIQNWSTCCSEKDKIMHPSLRPLRLHGKVYGHPKFEDGKEVTTGPVVNAEGRVITTSSGSVYKLGSIEPEYREWLKTDTPDWDWKNPIKKLTNRDGE